MGEFDTLFQTQLHHFADASSVAYSTVSYLRVIASNGTIFCNSLLGKSRLAPLKTVSFPRLELVAATMATKVDVSLRNNFGSSLSESVFWTDSMSVLYMIRNSAKRFPVFVSNRLAQIEDRSTSSQWRFVPSSDNPADESSMSRWLTGPSFLQEPESLWPQPPHSLPDLPAEFEIVKRMVAGTEVAVSDGDMEERFARFSSFYRLKRTVARILRLKGRLLRRPVPTGPLTVDEMLQAEMTVIAAVQREAFPKDYKRLETQNSPGKILKLSLQKLNPIYVAGVLRAGGRLRNAPLDFNAKHPIIMSANSQVTRLSILFCPIILFRLIFPVQFSSSYFGLFLYLDQGRVHFRRHPHGV